MNKILCINDIKADNHQVLRYLKLYLSDHGWVCNTYYD